MIVRASWLLKLKARLAGLNPNNMLLTTIGPFIIRGEVAPEPEDLLHERIHVAQWLELLGVGYYVIFYAWYFWGRIKHGSATAAYDRHPMEREAYAGMELPNYLEIRRHYAWVRLVGAN